MESYQYLPDREAHMALSEWTQQQLDKAKGEEVQSFVLDMLKGTWERTETIPDLQIHRYFSVGQVLEHIRMSRFQELFSSLSNQHQNWAIRSVLERLARKGKVERVVGMGMKRREAKQYIYKPE